MMNTANFLVCVILCSLQGRLDGFPTPRPSPYNLQQDNERSSIQPLASFISSIWTFPATRLHFSSTSSQQLLPMIGYDRISPSSDNNNGGNGISSSDPLFPLPPSDPLLLPPLPSSDFQVAIPPPEQRPSFDDETGWHRVPDVFQPSSAIDNGMSTSPSPSDDRLKISTTSSFVMRLSNFRLSKSEEAPGIMFDENGVMHTNYYPSRRAPQQ